VSKFAAIVSWWWHLRWREGSRRLVFTISHTVTVSEPLAFSVPVPVAAGTFPDGTVTAWRHWWFAITIAGPTFATDRRRLHTSGDPAVARE
jgi:hypothetical protein